MTTTAQFLAACRADLGYHESPLGSNCQKFAACAHHANCHAWCCTFLVCKARQTGLHLPNYGAFTPTMAQAFKDIGRYGHTPHVGAFAFVYHPELGRIAHVTAVEVVYSDGTFGDIGGNTNQTGGRTGGYVGRHRRTTTNITFGYPIYSTSAPVVHHNPYAVPVLTSSRPVLKAGAKMTSAEVKWVQWAAGIPLGSAIDGIWGPQTNSAVKAKQTHFGLKATAVVDAATLSKFKTVTR